MIIAGGLDIGLRKGIGLRLVQADWIRTDFEHVTLNDNGRFSTGTVLKF